MGAAASRCSADDRKYQSALFEYLDEERGHEEWILEDIEALGGDPQSVRQSAPRFPCKDHGWSTPITLLIAYRRMACWA